MNILVIDGQGGQLGSQLIKAILGRLKKARIMAVGTNAIATAAMLKAGAHQASTGENPVLVACRKADDAKHGSGRGTGRCSPDFAACQ